MRELVDLVQVVDENRPILRRLRFFRLKEDLPNMEAIVNLPEKQLKNLSLRHAIYAQII